MFLSLLLFYAPYMAFAVSLTDAEVKQIAHEIVNMKQELAALQTNFQLLKSTLKAQRSELVQVEQQLKETAQRLSEAEAELTRALQGLEELERALLQSKNASAQARSELSGLQQAYNTLSALYRKQQKEKIVWMTATVSLALVVTGFTIAEIVRSRR